MLLSGPPTTCTAPLLMMYISLPMSPCRESDNNQNLHVDEFQCFGLVATRVKSLVARKNTDDVTHFLHHKVSW